LATSVSTSYSATGASCWLVRVILLDRSQEPQVVDMKAFSSGHSPPKGAIAIAHAVCGLAGCPQVPDWLHSLEKQIAAGQLTVEDAVLMVIDFNSDLDDAQP
jgi:hypothetical protein